MTVCKGCGEPFEPGDLFCGAKAEPVTAAPGALESGKAANKGSSIRGPVLFVVPRNALEGSGGATLRQSLESGQPGFDNGTILAVDPPSSLKTVQAAIATDRNGSGHIQAVCLVGSDDELPMVRLADLSGHDESVLTDNLYGMTDTPSEERRYAGDILPDVPVSRIPTTDPKLVGSLVTVGDCLCPNWNSGFGVSAWCWQGASESVYGDLGANVGAPLRLSPPDGVEQVKGLLQPSTGRLFFNVHGSNQEPLWYGERDGDYPPILAPDAIRVARGAVVASEACYGALMYAGEPAIGRTFLAEGAGCFVGSTIIAWGPANPPPSLADLIAFGFFQELDRGTPAAAALLLAKKHIVERAIQGGNALSPQEHNTLTSFVLYGAPMSRCKPSMTKVKSGSGPARGPKPPVPRGPRGSVLDSIRSRMAGQDPPAGSESTEAITSVRTRLRQRLPPNTWAAISTGRIELAQLHKHFRDYTNISSNLARLLGAEPQDCVLFRYRSGLAERVSVTASTPWAKGRRLVALVADDQGTILHTWVSRGFAEPTTPPLSSNCTAASKIRR